MGYKSVRLVVLVDYRARPGLFHKKIGLASPGLVGLSIYAEAWGAQGNVKILFDTSSSWSLLKNNSSVLGLALGDLDAVVISHWHVDHTGGLLQLMRSYDVKVYAPPQGSMLSPLDGFIHFRLPRRPVIIREPREILRDIYTTGALEGVFPFPPFKVREQSIAIKLGNEGAVVLVGCSHPKPYRLVDEALKASSTKRAFLVIGGFHLICPTSLDEAKRIIRELALRPIDKIAPVHCSGDRGISLSRNALGSRHLEVMAGDEILVSEDGGIRVRPIASQKDKGA